jgi:hypothetical protein
MADAEFEDTIIRFLNHLSRVDVILSLGYAPHMLTLFLAAK